MNPMGTRSPSPWALMPDPEFGPSPAFRQNGLSASRLTIE
jgi:hypothetical protein